MIKAALNEAKDQLSKYIKEAVRDEVIVTKHRRPAAVIIGFESEEDRFDYRLDNDERFLARVEESRRQLRRGGTTFFWRIYPTAPLVAQASPSGVTGTEISGCRVASL